MVSTESEALNYLAPNQSYQPWAPKTSLVYGVQKSLELHYKFQIVIILYWIRWLKK